MHGDIVKDNQIKKFSAYGFLKNLKFFEPYLLIYLLANDISLLQIGILISIKEIMVNVFEIPSGIIADYFGRKKELCTCFVFYIISFVFFFLTQNFFIAAIAMIFFGLGEAFRTGTHKAMMYTYIESKGWKSEKTFIYGRTRSYSMLGSAVSSALGIVIIIGLPKSSYIFLASIIPYIIDFVLVASYPSYLDQSDINRDEIPSVKEMILNIGRNFKSKKKLRFMLYSNGLFESVIDCTKDFIQPIFEAIFIGSGIMLISSMTSENNLKVILGVSYFLIYLVSSFASKNSFRLKKLKTTYWWLGILYASLAAVFILLALFIESTIIILLLFIGMYLLRNVRKPMYVDVIEENMEKYERATVLSFSSQLKSLFVIILAPIIGYTADALGMREAMMIVALLLLVTVPLASSRRH